MDNRPPFLEVPAFSKFEGTLRVPGSKSISNRALLLAALARGETTLLHLLSSDDTFHMLRALEQSGVQITTSEANHQTIISGQGSPFQTTTGEFFLGNAGTATRTLTAALCLGKGEFTLRGEPRMYERPIGDLLKALRALGAQIDCLANEGFLPIHIHAQGLSKNSVSVRGNISSQYLTALLLCAPYTQNGLSIHVEGELISKPYIELTLQMMRTFGIEVQNENFENFYVQKGIYQSPGIYEIEGDASSASYALAAAAITGGKIRIDGVGKSSIQGDIRFADVLTQMGAHVEFGSNWVECCGLSKPLQNIDLNLNAIPDAAMTVAVLALFAKGTSRIRGIASWKVKETDRLSAMANELRKTGAQVETSDDSITITPPEHIQSATFETYNDHRMAMCFSLVSLANVPITIVDPACVNKTYPNYFDDFLRLAK